MISAVSISKQFGSLKALHQISFEIPEREVVGFLGPNGAGKTTLIRLITGIYPPTSGSILIEGKDFQNHPSLRKEIGYLAEHNPLYKEMTAQDFLNYIAALKGIPFRKRKQMIGAVVEQCQLETVLKRLIGKTSKGFQQRIGLAQALLGDPKILVLDEPTNGLDPAQIIEFRKLIQSLAQERTVILSTHILQEVEALCRRVLILNQGQIAAFLELGKTPGNLETLYMKVVGKESELCPR